MRPTTLLFFAVILISGLTFSEPAVSEPIGGSDATAVDLDNFIATQQPTMPGTRTILPPGRVSFVAVLKSQPELIKVQYLFEALAVMQIEPLPKVSHRIFVESAEGTIIPVYVEDKAVPLIKDKVATESQASFVGYHVYNYSKGPAIVVDSIN
ncbi:MAG: hypothetical protein AAF530_23660 [Pseudomonadota bacterium]